MSNELKPCPFCGHMGTLKEYERRFFFETDVFYYAQCNCCGARTELCEDASVATEKWNRRANDGKSN